MYLLYYVHKFALYIKIKEEGEEISDIMHMVSGFNRLILWLPHTVYGRGATWRHKLKALISFAVLLL